MHDVTLRPGSAADLPLLEPLWIAVHHQHQDVMPELAPYVTDPETWRERRALYETLLARPDTVLVLADAGDVPVGYGLAHVMPASGTWLADTWRTGERIGEIESLGVLPEWRGRGIGGRLLDALEEALTASGVRDLVLGALPGNTDAIRLYERRGFTPTWLYLSRLGGRSR
jgi:ribosomal protein S18 acetylase RimI-like enzyme